MPDETVEIPVAFLKALYGCGCMPDVKAALEKHFAEVVRPEPVFVSGSIGIGKSTGCPYLLTNYPGDMPFVNLINGKKHFVGEKKTANHLPMRSGTITLTVIDGKVARAEVLEG